MGNLQGLLNGKVAEAAHRPEFEAFPRLHRVADEINVCAPHIADEPREITGGGSRESRGENFVTGLFEREATDLEAAEVRRQAEGRLNAVDAVLTNTRQIEARRLAVKIADARIQVIDARPTTA